MKLEYVGDEKSISLIKDISESMSTAGARRAIEIMEEHDIVPNMGMALAVASAALSLIGAVGTLAEIQETPWTEEEKESFRLKIQAVVHEEQHRLHAKYNSRLN
jgi:hypothetical protein